jgi:hypothetical protein
MQLAVQPLAQFNYSLALPCNVIALQIAARLYTILPYGSRLVLQLR